MYLEEPVVFGNDRCLSLSKLLALFAHAFVGWVLCAATMGVGMAVTSSDRALVVHAVAAPIFFAGISAVYFRKFRHTRPVPTALAFVALLINRSLGMFASLLGTWIPFGEIFFATWLTGLYVVKRQR